MSQAKLPVDNPFATRAVKPGALPYLFEAGDSAELLVERLKKSRWRGEILGPHGSGKSTLLATLLPELSAAGRRVLIARLKPGEHRVPREMLKQRPWTAETLLVIDGYEQLGWCRQRSLIRKCDRTGCGLLVTAHQPTGLPVLMKLTPKVETALQVVQALLKDLPESITDAQIRQAFHDQKGDLREMLFQLYDLYEAQRRQSS